VLRPLGVTNDRLDEVSNSYRYQPQKGELWKMAPAKGFTIIQGGQVKKVVVSEAGSGYSSPPKVTIKGMEDVTLKATLHKEFKKNGSVESLEVVESPKSER
jgi:hypothetical protein